MQARGLFISADECLMFVPWQRQFFFSERYLVKKNVEKPGARDIQCFRVTADDDAERRFDLLLSESPQQRLPPRTITLATYPTPPRRTGHRAKPIAHVLFSTEPRPSFLRNVGGSSLPRLRVRKYSKYGG